MHEAFQKSTTFELLTEFYEDLFERDPKHMLDAMRGEDGEVAFEETGDPLIDKWERELAMGLEPDLNEGLSDSALQQLKRERNNKPVRQHNKNVQKDLFGTDDYSGLLLGKK